MSVIYCGKSNTVPYYIKEADLNVYSIQELAYFVYNYPMLISNNFVNKNLILYIYTELGMIDLSTELNDLYNLKSNNIAEFLKLILKYSNYYTETEIYNYDKVLLKLLDMNEQDYINLAGDKLFKLGKYEKAITQYNKIYNKNDEALKKIAFCYAKLQTYDKAIYFLTLLYEKNSDLSILKNIYFCYKLNGNIDDFNSIGYEVNDDLLADWDLEIVTEMLKAKNSDTIKNVDEIFLMGDKYVQDNMKIIIDLWKDKYRYIG